MGVAVQVNSKVSTTERLFETRAAIFIRVRRVMIKSDNPCSVDGVQKGSLLPR